MSNCILFPSELMCQKVLVQLHSTSSDPATTFLNFAFQQNIEFRDTYGQPRGAPFIVQKSILDLALFSPIEKSKQKLNVL